MPDLEGILEYGDKAHRMLYSIFYAGVR